MCLTACEKPRNSKQGSFVVLDEDDPETANAVQRKLRELEGELDAPLVGEEIAIAPDLAHWKAPPLELACDDRASHSKPPVSSI